MRQRTLAELTAKGQPTPPWHAIAASPAPPRRQMTAAEAAVGQERLEGTAIEALARQFGLSASLIRRIGEQYRQGPRVGALLRRHQLHPFDGSPIWALRLTDATKRAARRLGVTTLGDARKAGMSKFASAGTPQGDLAKLEWYIDPEQGH